MRSQKAVRLDVDLQADARRRLDPVEPSRDRPLEVGIAARLDQEAPPMAAAQQRQRRRRRPKLPTIR